MRANKKHISKIMKFNYICLVLVLVADHGYAASIHLSKRSTDDNNVLFELFKELFEEKCSDEINVTDVLSATAECLKQYFPTNINDLKNNLDALSLICSDAKEVIKVTNCFNEFNKLIQECTVPAEEYLKDFFMNSVEKAIDSMCNGTAGGTPLYRVLYTPEAIHCIESMSSNTIKECNQLQKINSYTTITKARLCGNLDQTKNCYLNYLSGHCSAVLNLNKFITETVNAVKSPCLDTIPVKPKVIVTPKPTPKVYNYTPQLYPVYSPPLINNPFSGLSAPSTTLVAGAGIALLPAFSAIPLFIG